MEKLTKEELALIAIDINLLRDEGVLDSSMIARVIQELFAHAEATVGEKTP